MFQYKTTAFLFALISTFSTVLHAQMPQLKNDIQVFANGVYLDNAWAGGLNNAQVSNIDLNNDGILDLIVYDRADYSISPFLGTGIQGSTFFEYAPEYIDSLPDDLNGWVLTWDFNQDGKMDIFTGTPTSNIKVFKNESATAGRLEFSLAASPIRSIYTQNPLFLYTPLNDVPAIGDIDGDGDTDILTFDVLGSQVEWHKCYAVDSGYSLDSLNFRMQSYCYGHFYEDPVTCTAFTNQTPCAAGMRTLPLSIEELAEAQKGVHAGSTMLLIDLNDDNIQDLLVGDVGCTSVYGMMNNGTQTIANFDSVLSNFPSYDTPIDVFNFPAMFYADVDNDGVKDLISAPNQVGGSIDRKSVWLHLNKGTNTNPDFEFSRRNYLQDEMIETGTGSVAMFFDYDRDSLLDLAVANQAEYGVGSPSKLAVYRNRGTRDIPEFELVSEDFANLSNNGQLENLVPAFGDLDGDGDQDLLLGDDDGELFHYENISTSGPANFVFVTNNFANIAVGTHSAPCLYDYDGDQDLDLFIGNARGYIHFYENQNNLFVQVTDTFGHVKINDFTNQTFSNGFAKPYFFDVDNDQQDELLVGTVEGWVEIFEITSNPLDSFASGGRLLNHDFGSYSSITAAVIDSVGASYLVGGIRGGVQLVGYPLPIVVGTDDPQRPADPFGVILFPNPATGQVNLRISGITDFRNAKFRIMTALGQVVAAGSISNANEEIQISGLSQGIYLVETQVNGQKITRKLVVE